MTRWKKQYTGKQLNLEHQDKWYKYKPVAVFGSENYKILWNMNIQTDKPIQARRLDVIIVSKKENILLDHKFCRSSSSQGECLRDEEGKQIHGNSQRAEKNMEDEKSLNSTNNCRITRNNPDKL